MRLLLFKESRRAYGVDMLFVKEKMFRDRFSEGSLYSMSGFDEVTTTSKFECAADRDVFICLSLFDGLAYEFHLKKLHVLVPNQALL